MSTIKFCEQCQSVLNTVTNEGELIFVCTSCAKEVKALPKDTLMSIKQVESTGVLKHRILIDNAHNDVTNPKIYKECPKCKEKIVKYIRTGGAQKRIFVCQCKYSWME